VFLLEEPVGQVEENYSIGRRPNGSSHKLLITNLLAKITRNKQILWSIAALFSTNVTSSFLGALGGLLVAHFLGPEETGLFRSFTIPLTYLTFLHLGTFDGLWRQIPFYAGKRMTDKVTWLASAAGAWNLCISFICSCGFIGFAFYSLWRNDSYGAFGWLSQAICCWGIFYGGYLGSTYRTLNQFVALSKIQMIQTMMNFCMVFLLPFLNFYGLCARAAFPPVLGTLFSQRNRPLKLPYHFDPQALSELIKIGLPFCFWGSLYTSIWAATESVLMLSLGGITGLGLFSAAVMIRDGLNTLPQAVYQVLLPRVVTNFAVEGSFRSATARIIWPTILLTSFMVLVIFIISPLLDIFVPYVIPKYVDGIPLMKICIWFAVIQAATLPLNTLFASGKPWLYGRGVIFGLLVFPVATYLLIPVLGGILAVATGSLLGRTARTIAAYIEIASLLRHEE